MIRGRGESTHPASFKAPVARTVWRPAPTLADPEARTIESDERYLVDFQNLTGYSQVVEVVSSGADGKFKLQTVNHFTDALVGQTSYSGSASTETALLGNGLGTVRTRVSMTTSTASGGSGSGGSGSGGSGGSGAVPITTITPLSYTAPTAATPGPKHQRTPAPDHPGFYLAERRTFLLCVDS